MFSSTSALGPLARADALDRLASEDLDILVIGAGVTGCGCALDAITRQNLQDEVAKLATETGMTVLFITHDIEEAIYLGDRVVAMESRPGRISAVLDINLPRPRDQLTTREDERFLRYRHELFKYLPRAH